MPRRGYFRPPAEPGVMIVTDKNGNKLTVTDAGNNKYTFTMPNGARSM